MAFRENEVFVSEICVLVFSWKWSNLLKWYVCISGLQVLGIFRVGCSKKKTKQLRDEFDSGADVRLGESHNPHEVGAVLKEYFRDLPEPLLTRDLYTPFIAARGNWNDFHVFIHFRERALGFASALLIVGLQARLRS